MVRRKHRRAACRGGSKSSRFSGTLKQSLNVDRALLQMEKLADSLPNENAAELEQRIGALQAENAALEVQLRESLARAGALCLT